MLTKTLAAAVTAAAMMICVPVASADSVAYFSFGQSPSGGYVGAFMNSGTGTAQLSVTRGGAEVATASGNGGTYVNLSPQTGDVVRIVRGSVTRELTFDGRPTFDPATVCAGSKTLGGLRSGSATFESGGSYVENSDPYAVGNLNHASSPQLSGDSWSATLERPLTKGERAYVSFDGSSGDVSVSSTLQQIVGACPVPAAQTIPTPTPNTTPVAPDKTAPTVSLALGSINTGAGALKRMLKAGAITNTVTLSEPGTVSQLLVLDRGGKLPASAAAKKPALKLGKGVTVAKVAGKIKVTVKLSKAGKRALRGVKRAKLALITTVTDVAGNKTTTTKRFSATRG